MQSVSSKASQGHLHIRETLLNEWILDHHIGARSHNSLFHHRSVSWGGGGWGWSVRLYLSGGAVKGDRDGGWSRRWISSAPAAPWTIRRWASRIVVTFHKRSRRGFKAVKMRPIGWQHVRGGAHSLRWFLVAFLAVWLNAKEGKLKSSQGLTFHHCNLSF